MGDKRNQRVHDLDSAVEECRIDDILKAETYLAFGPDTLPEARNRGYHHCHHCVAPEEVSA
jgi:hypothetical protein